MTAVIQASFAKGEIAPALYGRVDTTLYQSALKTARNLIIKSSGAAMSRPGLTFVGPVKDHTYAPRLFEFQFKTLDTYQLEIGDFYMRVIRNDAHVTETPVAITAITKANPGVVTATSHGYSNGDEVFLDGIVGMTRLNDRRFLIKNVTTNTFSLADQVTDADLDTSGYTTYVSGGTVARIYTLVTPWAKADLPLLKGVQSADVMTMTHALYPVIELGRVDHDNWTLTFPAFKPTIANPTGVGVTVNSTGSVTRRYQVTAVAPITLEESLPGLNTTTKTITAITQANPAVVASASHGFATADEVEIDGVVGMTQVNGQRFQITVVDSGHFSLNQIDSTAYGAYVSGGTANQTFVQITNGNLVADDTVAWTMVAGALKYNVYCEENGLYGFVGSSQTSSWENTNFAPDLTTAPPSARNPFLLPGEFPGCASYYEQRRVMGGSTQKPDTSYYSQIASEENYSISDPGQPDDAITATLVSRQVNEIRHFVPGNDLLIFTSGSEWAVNSNQATSFDATTITQKPQSSWGASHNVPIILGRTVLFVTENASAVRTMTFSWQISGYDGVDISITAPHLFETYPIIDWTYARSPDPVLYLVRGDGQMCCCTYNSEQQMTAWTHWDTLGNFEATSSLRHSATEIDEAVYFVVQRVINGNVVRYIERTHSRRFTDVRDCFFVDAGLSYDAPVSITGISVATPCVVTAPAHGFSNGDTVDLFDINWVTTYDSLFNEVAPDQLNTHRYTVASKTTDTFELVDAHGATVDSSAFSVYLSGGTVRKAVTTISSLDHLEGQNVVVLADGNVISNLTVLNGSITLPRPFSRVHIGLRFIADLETLNIEAPGSGTIQGAMKKIAGLTIRFERSRGLLFGYDNLNLREMKQREFENMGDPTALLTGDKQLTMTPSFNTNGRIFLRQVNPLPMTILAIVPSLEVGE